MAEETTISIYSVLGSPALKEAFKWHSVTLYCPENLMFVDKIDHAWRAMFLRKHEAHESVSMAKYIWNTFFSTEAQWEVSLNTNERNRLEQIITKASSEEPMDADLFDKAYDHVVRDMSRSLANFQTTEFWKAYCANKTVVEEMYVAKRSGGTLRRSNSGTRGRSESIGHDISGKDDVGSVGRARAASTGESEGSSESIDYDNVTRAEVMARVRALYRTTQQVRLQKVPTKEFYHCLVGEQIRGRAKLEGETFYFMDMDEKLLLNVPYTVLFDKESMELSQIKRKGLQRRVSMPTQLSSRLQAQVEADAAKQVRISDSKEKKPVMRRTSGNLARRNSVSKQLKRQNSKGKLSADAGGNMRSSSGKLSLKLDEVTETKPAGLRRGSSTAILKKDMTKRRASTGLNHGNTALMKIHFKNKEGNVCGPLSIADAKLLWKYHLIEPKSEMSVDAGMNWSKVIESEFFNRSNQIQSIDPTVIVRKF